MDEGVFSIDVGTNTVSGLGGCVRLRHHQAGAFLAALVERLGGGTERQLCAVGFVALWRTVDGPTKVVGEPDRTAMRRVLRAVKDGLLALGCTSRVMNAQRHDTVGPWWLVVGAEERWQVVDSRTGAPHARREAADSGGGDDGDLHTLPDANSPSKGESPPFPRLCVQRTPAAALGVVAAVMIADDLARQAQYGDAVAHLASHQQALGLSAEARAVFAVRQVRWLRRSGLRAEAQAVMLAVAPSVRKAHPQVRGLLTAEFALQTARLTYDENPTGNAPKINFERLGQQIGQAGSAQLLWEVCNLQALACRRKLQALLAREVPAQAATLLRVAQQATDCFEAAFFWLTLAGDAYHLQAVLVNYAYHLQWPLSHQLNHVALVSTPDQIAHVVEAWRLSQAVIEKFDLPEDSAWDYIMLADLWLGQPQVRAVIRSDWRLWPGNRSPAVAAFYARGVELARQTGDARQQALALDRSAAFHKDNGDSELAQHALRELDGMRQADAELAAQLCKEKLWTQRNATQRNATQRNAKN